MNLTSNFMRAFSHNCVFWILQKKKRECPCCAKGKKNHLYQHVCLIKIGHIQPNWSGLHSNILNYISIVICHLFDTESISIFLLYFKSVKFEYLFLWPNYLDFFHLFFFQWKKKKTNRWLHYYPCVVHSIKLKWKIRPIYIECYWQLKQW